MKRFNPSIRLRKGSIGLLAKNLFDPFNDIEMVGGTVMEMVGLKKKQNYSLYAEMKKKKFKTYKLFAKRRKSR